MASPRLVAVPLVALVALYLGSANAFYSSSGPVVELTSGNLKQKLKAAGIMLTEFYAPWCGHCQSLKPAWEQAAKALKGIVAVGAADCDAHKEIAQEYRVQGFPTIKLLYVDESGSIKSTDYNGGRTAKELVTFALDKARSLAMKRLGEKDSGSKSSGGSKGSRGGNGGGGSDGGFYGGTDVVTLTDDNFKSEVIKSNDLWLVEFYAPWCGHCKNLKPSWIEAASELQGKFKLGAVDCTVHQSVCSEHGVQGYPTIKYFGTNKRSPEDYQGGRDTGSIVAFGNAKHADNVPPPEPEELVSQAAFEEHCVGNGSSKPKRLCLIAFLPNLLDSKAAGRKRYVGILKKVAEAYRDKPYSYLWVEGGVHDKLEANFDVGGFGYPALVAFNPADKKYTVCKSAFEFSHVKDWVESMRMGGTGAVAMQGSLAPLKAITAWDGQDAKEDLPEEFSLDELNEL
ncbi:hypothetical protein HYH03_005115 [Edaphochlamys debaryana]|uniref:protein disulfide-isomerase n=1 Tax=Edaphochlamys debaryana TaxID=47281 RepID=A0A835YFL0_9CHLO|nr:hypothetical protein HYH03_005115 [Edaphochlamys debaryana]|eukprot:KAG2496699.1 hypothetical protein HYH03_005115 [Edaphochlamys debaryana]